MFADGLKLIACDFNVESKAFGHEKEEWSYE